MPDACPKPGQRVDCHVFQPVERTVVRHPERDAEKHDRRQNVFLEKSWNEFHALANRTLEAVLPDSVKRSLRTWIQRNGEMEHRSLANFRFVPEPTLMILFDHGFA